MSFKAVEWALNESPCTKPSVLLTLVALCENAHDDGTGAFPSQATLAYKTRKSERQVRRDLQELEDAGLIERADQWYVAGLPEDRRPIVWRACLHMKRVDERPVKFPASGNPRIIQEREDIIHQTGEDVDVLPSVDNSRPGGHGCPPGDASGGHGGQTGGTPMTDRGDVDVRLTIHEPSMKKHTPNPGHVTDAHAREAPVENSPVTAQTTTPTPPDGVCENNKTTPTPHQPTDSPSQPPTNPHPHPTPSPTPPADDSPSHDPTDHPLYHDAVHVCTHGISPDVRHTLTPHQKHALLKAALACLNRGWSAHTLTRHISGCTNAQTVAPYACLDRKFREAERTPPKLPTAIPRRSTQVLPLHKRPCRGQECTDSQYRRICDDRCAPSCPMVHAPHGAPGSCRQCGSSPEVDLMDTPAARATRTAQKIYDVK